MDMKPIPARNGNDNFGDYDTFCKHFTWGKMDKQFSWDETGRVNIAYEALERHAVDPAKKNKPAFIYSSPTREETYTFSDVSNASNQFANVLKKYGVHKGDAIFLFMPCIPEFYFSFFGILKTGAVVGVLYEELREQAIRDRLEDSKATILVTTAELVDRVPYQKLPHLKRIIVLGNSPVQENYFVDYKAEMNFASNNYSMEWVDLEDGMLLHYTANSTGKPKGVYHVHRAMIQQYATAEWVLDLKENDIYWSTTNPAWVSGTSYGIFAPWLHGVTSFVYEGKETAASYYEALEKYRVTVWYTNPSVLRMLVSEGEETAGSYDLSSLRHLLSGGDQLHPEMITWGLQALHLRIHDTWMMAETGAQLIVNFPNQEIRPGSMGKPIPGIKAATIDHEGNELKSNQVGNLAIKSGWPAMMHAIWNNPGDYESYFLNDWFITGDRAYQDEDGYFWFQDCLDDVIHPLGEHVGPFEIESLLIQHPAVNEAGVIGKPHPKHGEIIKAFITLQDGYEQSDELKEDIRRFIKQSLSVNRVPDEIDIRKEIPKTQSGKVMRHLLKSWDEERPTRNGTY